MRREAPRAVTLATAFSPGTPWGQQMRWLTEEIERATEGQLVARVELRERRGGDVALLERVRAGELAGALVESEALANLAPALVVVQAPFLFRGYAEVESVLDSLVRGPLDAQLASYGLAFGAWGEAGFHALASPSRPILAPQGLRGARLWSRATDWSWPAWRALGARLVSLRPGQVGAAASAGELDALIETPWRLIYGGWHRRVDHVVLTGHRYEPMVLVWNRRWWQSLPRDVRDIIDQRAQQATGRGRRLVRGLQADLRRILDDEGVAIHVPSARERREWERVTGRARFLVAGQYGDRMVELLAAIERATRDLR